MKKTLYYKTVVREYDLMKSDGFIIAEVKEGKLIRLEGVFSEDYLITDFIGDRKFLSYFSKVDAVGEYERRWIIEMIEIELPLNLQALVDVEYQDELVSTMVELKTIKTIQSKEEKERCNKRVLEIRDNVLGKERN